MATTTVKPGALTSRIRAGLPDRWTGRYANPIGSTASPTRETAPVMGGAPPRVQHPKLNTKPWSTSMAVKRQPMPERKSKGQVRM